MSHFSMCEVFGMLNTMIIIVYGLSQFQGEAKSEFIRELFNEKSV